MRSTRLVVLILVLISMLGVSPQSAWAGYGASDSAQGEQPTGGVNILSVQPDLICVGDSVPFEGAAGVDFPDLPGDPPLAPLKYISLTIQAQNGQVSPNTFWFPKDFSYFTFNYKATKAGTDTITITLNNGLATYKEPVRVQEKCDYDAYLMTLMHFSADLGDDRFESMTTVTGTGIMKRDRQGSEFFQGDGTWHLEEIVLSKPSMCVQWYMPPLITSGPFDLDGHLDHEGDLLDVILSFKPRGTPVYHGKSICVDADGNQGEGWGIMQGGDPQLASKIETSVPLGGGTQQVELKGEGMQMVQSQGDLDYSATLTILPR